MALTNTNGTVVEKYSYDAFGNRRNPLNWSQPDTRTNLMLDRGYTGHEHLDGAHIINMNGRMYDPIVGRMLSPDPILQNPYSTQNYNRYSYVVNNPLKYTDPTGYSMLHRILEEEIHGGNGLPSWYAGDDFFGGNSNNSNYHFYNNISHIANNQLGASGGWVYNFVSGEYDNALTGETMSRASMSYYLNSKAKRNDTGLDGRQVLYDAKNNTVTANLFDIYETAYSFGDVTNAGGSGFSMVEERFIQATGILGFSGPTIGLSIAKFPNGEFGVYWNNGNTTGVDLPNLDIGVTVHMSRNPNIDWETALQGWSSDWGGSYSFFGFTVGGNQYSGDFWSKFMKDYGSVSIMLNLGPNDLAGGANKNTTNQQHLFTLPMWFDIFW
jgi:RHS repeat-associated protein